MTALLEAPPETKLATDVEIRDARPDDAEAIHRILLSNSAIQGLMRLPNQTLAETVARLEPSEGAMRFVAVVDEEIVGFSELLTYAMAPRHRHAADINLIVVAEHAHGLGIGRSLMNAMLDLTDNWLQVSRVGLIAWVTNSRAIALYESLGFEREGVMRDYVYTNGSYVDAVQMARLADSS